MQDITDLERRIRASLERIGEGLDALAPEPAEPDADDGLPDASTLMAELEAERALTEQLRERLATSRDKSDARVREMEDELAAVQSQLSACEEDRARLRETIDALGETCESLRRSNAKGVSDPALINSAVETELEALRAVRRSDRRELDAIVSLMSRGLEPGETQDA